MIIVGYHNDYVSDARWVLPDIYSLYFY